LFSKHFEVYVQEFHRYISFILQLFTLHRQQLLLWLVYLWQ